MTPLRALSTVTLRVSKTDIVNYLGDPALSYHCRVRDEIVIAQLPTAAWTDVEDSGA